ncbi:MAG: DUF4199 domain-containing protein [Sphingorhabdus sp.]
MRYNPIITSAGIFSGAGAALWTLFEYAMGWHSENLETGAVTGFVAIIFPIAAIIWALRATRRANGGQLTFKQSLTCGLAISAISAAIGLVFLYAYYTWINPAFIDAMKARGQDVNVTAQLAAVVMGTFVLGLLISAVAGFFLCEHEEKTQNER